MQALLIVVGCVCAAVFYGIVHDQITARICIEYFTIGHPPIFETTSPSLLALGWGVIATWWVGLPLGVLLALSARLGRRPKRDARSLVAPVSRLLILMAVCAVAAGIIGSVLASRGLIYLAEPLASSVPVSRHARFLADLWSHSASYLSGIAGGLFLIARTWRLRANNEAGQVQK
jgi:hypothetical protein